jgi:cyclic beta-1,2-glucan synthetase
MTTSPRSADTAKTHAAVTAVLARDPHGKEPIRGEQFGLEHLEAHARRLAQTAVVAPVVAGKSLLTRFEQNERALLRAHRLIRDAYRRGEVFGADAEWLLDNFHIITDTLREIHTDLPGGYYHLLPKLVAGPLAGFPRVYALALELIAHCDSCLDEANITQFVRAYQAVTPLTIGELWAVPIMLRLILIDNLRRLADQILEARAHRLEARSWLPRCLATAAHGPRPLDAAPPPRANWSDAFVVHLLESLQDHGAVACAAIEWLENHLQSRGTPRLEVVRREQQRLAANQVTIGNCVISLRLLSAIDWNVFFEKTSVVEAVLREDPAGAYPRQDFASRDRYRRELEKLARGSGIAEWDVARRLIRLTAGTHAEPPTNHVGYYLLGRGRLALERALGYVPKPADRFRKALLARPPTVYFGTIGLLLAVILIGIVAATWLSWTSALLVALVALIPAGELAVGLTNYLLTHMLAPRTLPKLDFKAGIPADCATFVAVPSMLIRPESAQVLAEKLEVHYLANPDANLRFALLTDFADAPAEHMSEDDSYVKAALERIRALNERYAAGGPDRFFLFHRHRQWNPRQNCWMGWERKRGKLLEFNRLLRGATDTSYTVCSGALAQLPTIRFVLTLDVDTGLPRETARRLIGTLAHPLNQPCFDATAGRVVEGYGILQPRVCFRVTSALQSRFARLLANSAGVDPYSTAVSDIYQDLFGAGSYTGKGLYDVDAFTAAVGATFPDNSILSHDLIESNYARCGLVTDIELFDDFPARYHAYARREHRWVRGDWQLLPWLLGWAKRGQEPFPRPGASASEQPRLAAAEKVPDPFSPKPLPLLERWKIFDNLRRSLVPPALMVLLILGWTVLPGAAWLWTALAAAVLALPLLLQVLGMALRTFTTGLSLRECRYELPATLGQVAVSASFLADQARLMVDAIGRTVYRLLVTRRQLLEWETAASTERRLGGHFTAFCLDMWPACALTGLAALVVALVQPEALPAASPFLIAWLLSPALAFWISQPLRLREPPLTVAERRTLRRIARKTWGFFETFVGVDDNWLPPDNYQEDPKGVVAHRTSPTNIGMLLLSTLTAHDLGYLSLRALANRLEKTLDTLDRLERFRGHFLNWYDTRSLHPLQPGYVSTVDSGNLAGCLLALQQGLRQLVSSGRKSGGELQLVGPALAEGLSDTLKLAEEELASLEDPEEGPPLDALQKLRQDVAEVHRLLESPPADLAGWDAHLAQVDRRAADMSQNLRTLAGALHEPPEELDRWLQRFTEQVDDWRDFVGELVSEDGAAQQAALRERCLRLAERAGTLAGDFDFRFLYNEQRHLFSIGYNLGHGRLDSAHYDLLASEACLSSFLGVARGDLPRKHWFQLSRPLTRVDGQYALLSWGGTMFEYLMPRLLLRPVPTTLLAVSQQAAVQRQMDYGRQNRVPWGISESAFAALDINLDYQYQSFGTPGLGLKRGLANDLVIAPYATALALMIRPRAALQNLQRLSQEGGEGPYGFYEALDYTRERLPRGQRLQVVRNFMAHHQGMSLVAMANCLLDDIMVRRFQALTMVRAADLLLQERVPASAPLVQPQGEEPVAGEALRDGPHPLSRRLTTPHTRSPRCHLLSNGQYSVMVTNAGAGFSTCNGLDVTRWREDRTRDCWGQFIYIRDLRSGLLWSAAHQPIGRSADEYEVTYSADKAEFRRIDGGIETHYEIVVSPENNAEVRRVTLTNHNSRPHELEVTSYAEVVLGPHGGDLAHAAFGKLFLETEWLPDVRALLCRRRPRAPEQKPVFAAHVLSVNGPTVGRVQFETDRARFLGRGRTPEDPLALEAGTTLSGTTGAVLDPIFSLRRRVKVEGGAAVTLVFTTVMADTREEIVALADQYDDPHAISRTLELAWAHSQVELRHLRLSGEQVHLFQRLAGALIYAGTALRAPAEVLLANRQGQTGLWRHGISGDRPILLARVAEAEELPLVRQLLAAHNYWRLKGLQVDLVILNEHPAGYFEELHQQLQNLVRASNAHELIDKPGGIFLRKADHMAEEDRFLLQAAARVVLAGNRGSLTSQVERAERLPALPPRLMPLARRSESPARRRGDSLRGQLLFFNGVGGFTPDGREYVILREGGERGAVASRVPRADLGTRRATAPLPPAPWINVIANPACGFLVSERGAGYSWAGNSQTNRLTSWSNDPVSDPPSEIVYLRDENTGEIWTCPEDPRRAGEVIVRHGAGYTVFEQGGHGVVHDLRLLVPPADPVKIYDLRLKNEGPKPRRLSVTFYADWVLGTVRDQAAMYVLTELDPESGALLARNPFNADFGSRVAFADVNLRPRTVTSDRTEFLGRNGSPAAPAALERMELSGRVAPGVDPCAALQVKLVVQPRQEARVVFLLGQAAGVDEARQLVYRYREPANVDNARTDAGKQWESLLSTVQVQTPDPGMNVLVNRWLLVQVLACRVWGRSAFYQSGGAYGFRDQLQDVMALVYGLPAEARAHILRAASRQFVEGDVQHWWHPPAGRGVRTRFSDDFLWLPFAVAHYVHTTGDRAILDETVPFLQGPQLKPDQEEDYGQPQVSAETAPLVEHCYRAIDHGLRFGAHGLPLMGTGDWNDGMNRVGAGGQGESVWNGWFQLTILPTFAELAEQRGHSDRAQKYRDVAQRLRAAIEENTWDGEWYRRAYFDDGTPLGSAQNDECRIDSLAQTWAVIASSREPAAPSSATPAAHTARLVQAMAAVERHLVHRDTGLILLFTPPFDGGKLQPGYIKGYVPGIRENGGQYTHAATWVVEAAALLGQGERAVELFDLLNPIGHAATPESVARYKVEPYVVAADVYGVAPHEGRGGWTWYTGSAGWLYRIAVETILGFKLQGNRLHMDPCIAPKWPRFEMTYRYRSTTYSIVVLNPDGVERGVRSVKVDGAIVEGGEIPLSDDGQAHQVEVLLG